jgi:hypothetical protein
MLIGRRWLLDRDDTPWYPTARLFRQANPGDWTTVVQDICTALKQVVDHWSSHAPAPVTKSGNGISKDKEHANLQAVVDVR